ncbi:MAG: MBL fold metallo-hydrolase [Nocardioidaceae bacterium]
MELTKFSHACVRLEDGDRRLVIDPGSFSEVEEALAGVHAVLITHEHADHVDVDALSAAAARDSALRVWAPPAVCDLLPALGDRVTSLEPGAQLEVAGFEVRTLGGQHALIHSSVPVVPNIGFVVDGALYHPGDAFVVPPVEVSTVLVPVHAPWSKVGEVLDFLIATRAAHAYNIHDGLLNQSGLRLVAGHLHRVGEAYGAEYRTLSPRETVSL